MYYIHDTRQEFRKRVVFIKLGIHAIITGHKYINLLMFVLTEL